MLRNGLVLAVLGALAASGLNAQSTAADVDWKEGATAAPPPLRTRGLVPFELAGSTLRWGVDPTSITIGADRIVRYVVVAQGEGGAVNALYEGLRCGTGEVKVYARHARDGAWVPASGDWKALKDNGAARHSLAIARGGACLGHAPNSSAERVARDLGSNPAADIR